MTHWIDGQKSLDRQKDKWIERQMNRHIEGIHEQMQQFNSRLSICELVRVSRTVTDNDIDIDIIYLPREYLPANRCLPAASNSTARP